MMWVPHDSTSLARNGHVRRFRLSSTHMTKSRPPAAKSPASLGFSMPAEWETHEGTWLAWPHHPTDWPGKLNTIRWVYAEIVRKIAAGETVRLLVRSKDEAKSAARYMERAGADIGAVEFIVYPTNRGWMRDSGPLSVRRSIGRRLETAIVQFHFSAWAKYDDWQKDRRVPEMAARRLGKRLFDAPIILEGGGIEVNGRGTLVMFCGMTPILARTALGSRMMSYPATMAVPLVGGTSVVNMRMSVLLPAPFGPSRPKISPPGTMKLTLSTASSAPKRLLMPSTSMATPFWDWLCASMTASPSRC